MALTTLVAYSAADTETAAGLIKDTMVSAGWTLHDDQATASDYYILSSDGASSDKMTCYYQIDWSSTNSIIIYLYTYWNATTHAGVCKIGISSYSKITTDDASPFWLWVYADEDFVGLTSKVGTAYYGQYVENYSKFWEVEGTLGSAVTSGSSKVITLGSGEGTAFTVGVEYQIVSPVAEGRELTTVTAKTANTITVDSLTSGYAAGSVIGQTPFTWLTSSGANTYLLSRAVSGTGANATTNVSVVDMLDYAYTNPDEVGDQKYTMWPVIYQDRHSGTLGYGGHGVNVAAAGSTYEDTLGVGTLESSTATGGTVSLLTDSAQSWTTNEFQNKGIVITSGTGSGDVRKITSNTSTGIVPDDDFSAAPDATSTFAVYNEVWRYFYFAATTKSRAFREV